MSNTEERLDLILAHLATVIQKQHASQTVDSLKIEYKGDAFQGKTPPERLIKDIEKPEAELEWRADFVPTRKNVMCDTSGTSKQ